MSRTRFEMGAEAPAPPERRGRMAGMTLGTPGKNQGTRFCHPGQSPMAEARPAARKRRKSR